MQEHLILWCFHKMALPQSLKNEIQRRKAEGLKKGRINKPAKWLFPQGVEREYRRSLIAYINTYVQTLEDILIPQLDSLHQQAVNPRADNLDIKKNIHTKYMAFTRTDDWVRDLTNLVDATTLLFERRAVQPQQLATLTGNNVSNFNKGQFQKVAKSALGVDVLSNEPQLATRINSFTAQNVALITGLKDDAQKKVQITIQNGFNQGKSVQTISKELTSQMDITKRRAELIARDQIASLNGQLTKDRQTSIGVERFIWSTSGDERVRDEHAALDGKEFSWDNLPSEGAPGDAINCRCVAIPVFSDLL